MEIPGGENKLVEQGGFDAVGGAHFGDAGGAEFGEGAVVIGGEQDGGFGVEAVLGGVGGIGLSARPWPWVIAPWVSKWRRRHIRIPGCRLPSLIMAWGCEGSRGRDWVCY